MKHFLNDDKKAELIKLNIENDALETILNDKEFLLVKYAKKLTCSADKIALHDIETLRNNNCND